MGSAREVGRGPGGIGGGCFCPWLSVGDFGGRWGPGGNAGGRGLMGEGALSARGNEEDLLVVIDDV